MKLVLVGGHSRNIGKTSAVAGIIAALVDWHWTAVKITQFGHNVCSTSDQLCDCATPEHTFAITQEENIDSGSDTSRFLAAGARRALWVRTKEGELVSALPDLKKELERDRFVIVESNSLRRFLTPTIYLQLLDPLNPDFKLSAQQFFHLADAYLIVGDKNSHLPREIKRSKQIFYVSAQEKFINNEVIEFVKARIFAAENAEVSERF